MKKMLRTISAVTAMIISLTARSQTPLSVDSSLTLQLVATTPGKIIDLKGTKALIIDDGPLSHPRIIDISTNQVTPIGYNGQVQTGFLTPQGAMLSTGPTTNTGSDSLYDFNAGNLYPLGQLNRGSLRVAGQYGIWSKPSETYPADSLFLRNVTSQNQLLVYHHALTNLGNVQTSHTVADNGLVVYTDSARDLVKYLAGDTTIVMKSPKQYTGPANPLTDGYNVAFQYVDELLYNSYVMGPDGDLSLTPPDRDFRPGPWNHYQVNNRNTAWIVRVRVFPGGNWETRLGLRLAGGSPQRILFNGLQPNELDLLGPQGHLVITGTFNRKLTRWLIAGSDPVQRVDSTTGKTYYTNNDWYIAIDNRLYKLNRPTLTPPPTPILTGLQSSYCSTAGNTRVRIANLPDTGTTIHVWLDASSLSVNRTDSSITLPLATGNHTLIIRYTNAAGAVADTSYFGVVAPATPQVKLTADATSVSVLPIPVTITATPIAAGGTQPRYIFARDRTFTSILQGENSSNTLTIMPASLQWGENTIYGRLKTSDTCVTASTAIDSVIINKRLLRGVITNGSNHQRINVFPNPFSNFLVVIGLNTAKSYRFTLFNANAQAVLQRETANRSTYQILVPPMQPGVYHLTVTDRSNNQVLGTIQLLKLF